MEQEGGSESSVRPEIYYDPLTKLPNRALFQNRLEQSVAQAQRSGEQLAIHYIGLDQLETLIQTHGREVGEGLIRGLAVRLRSFIRKSDTLTRLKGGEFAIIQRNVGNTMGVTTLVQKVLDALAQPLSVEGLELRTSASVGISLYTPGLEPEEFMAQAEKALHKAAEESREAYRFHDEQLGQEIQTKVVLQDELGRALERGEFFLEYQSQVNLTEDRILASEALVRWRHPERGVVEPKGFIRFAEDAGLIVPLGRWVLEEASRQRKAWSEAGLVEVPVAVNVSGVQFRDPGFPDQVLNTLKTVGLEPDLLDLEFTESVLLQSPETLRDSLGRLHERGVKFSIDDFGTGYSSLRYLRTLPVQKLKIAGEFVRDVASNPDAAAIVDGVISLGHKLDLQVVAEGVETEEQVVFLREHGCDGAQGYLFDRPEGPGAFAQRLR